MTLTIQKGPFEEEWHVWAHLHQAGPEDVSVMSESFVIGSGLTRRKAIEQAKGTLYRALSTLHGEEDQ